MSTLDDAIGHLAAAQQKQNPDAADTIAERDAALRDVIVLGIHRLGLRLVSKPGDAKS